METAKTLRKRIRTMMREIHAATLISREPSQNCMTTEAAEISAQSVMADWYQFWIDGQHLCLGNLGRFGNLFES